MSDLHRCGPPTERIHTDAGLFFETDLARLPPAGAEPLRHLGVALGNLLERHGFARSDPGGPLERAAEALRRDASRLEAYVSRVTAGADPRSGLAEVLRGSGFLLRRIVRELEAGDRRSADDFAEKDLQDV
jgi:hypothetical protein